MAMEATEYAFPFDAEECEGGYDREYIADDFARYFRAFITSGIIADGGNIAESLQVVANDDMTTTLKKGNLIINGYRYELVEDMIFHHTAADGVLDRIDRISITLDTAEREIHAAVRESEYSYKPVAPQCRRTSEHLDYVVADVRVVAGSIKIVQANITDTRLSTELCGVAFPFWRLDTQPFFAQLNSFYSEFVAKSDRSYQQFQDWQGDKKAEIEVWQAAEVKQTDDWQKKETDDLNEWANNFINTWEGWMSGKVGDWTNEILDWFNNLREQLTDNAEVKLQEQIGNLNNLKTENKDNLVSAINTVEDAVDAVKDIASKAVKKTGDTMSGTLNSSKTANTHLEANRGSAIINSTAAAGGYTMLDKLNSTNGYFTDGVYGGKREFHYTSKKSVDAGTNAVEKTLVLMDESGNTTFPGKVTANSFVGNASKVTNIFSDAASRALPTSGEALDTTIGKIRKYLSDLKGVAFSGSYKGLDNRTIKLIKRIIHESANSEYTEVIIASDGKEGFSSKSRSLNKIWLVVGSGSSCSTSYVMGATDFARAYLIVPKHEASSVSDCKGRSFLLLQLGSSGSAARYTLAAAAATGNNDEKITIKIPKGSAAMVNIYELSGYYEDVG